MREHHPMRYHRMTEILKTVASVKLSSTFLLKVSLLTASKIWSKLSGQRIVPTIRPRIIRANVSGQVLYLDPTWVSLTLILELFSEKAIANANGPLYIQCFCCWIYSLCS